MMKLEGWIIYDLEGNFLANRSRKIVERQLDDDKKTNKDDLKYWEGEGCRIIPVTIEIPDAKAMGRI